MSTNKRINQIEELLKKFRWATLGKMYGCAHSSIIGFISTEWINLSGNNSILDGAPSPYTGQGRTGQRNADIILCQADKPLIVVEVETQVGKYREKLSSIYDYLENDKEFNGIGFGLMIMINLCSGDRKYKHSWDEIKKEVRNKNYPIALVSLEKERVSLGNSILDKLRKRNDYFPWEVINIDFWIYSDDEELEGNLWKKN